VLLLTLLPLLALAQPQEAPSGVLTRAPQVVTFVEADYPQAAAEQGVTGTVTLSVDLDVQGHVENVAVVESPRPDFAEAAQAAVKRFVFSPAEIDGKPSAVTLTYRYEFKVVTQVVKLGPQVNFEGTVLERFKKKALAKVQVSVIDVGVTTLTDEAGHFEFVDLPLGPHQVKLSGDKLVEVTTEEVLEKDQKKTVKYRIEEKEEGVDIEVTVRASRLKKESVQTSIRTEEARRVPGTQGDTLKVVQNLPGVARSSFGSGQLIVWGSSPKETRVVIDGVESPSLYHVGGLRSVVNGDLVKSIDLLPGAFGPEYGRGLGGLVKIDTRALPDKGVHGSVSVDFLDASATLSAVVGERLRVAVSGRYSYLDRLLAGVISPDVSDFFPIPRYSDYQAKATLALRKDEELGLLFLGSHDDYQRRVGSDDPSQVRSEETGQHVHRLALRYTRLLEDGSSFTVTPFIGFDQNVTGSSYGSLASNLTTRATKPGLRAQYRAKLLPTFVLTLGTDVLSTATRLSRTGSVTSPPREGDAYIFGRRPSDDLAHDTWSAQLTDASVFALGELSLGLFTFTGGVRVDAYLIDVSRLVPQQVGVPALGTSSATWAVDPRASVTFKPFKRWSLTASAGLYHQGPDAEDLSSVFGNPTLTLQEAVHTSLASNLKLTGTLSLDVVGYWKKYSNLVSRSEMSTPPIGGALTQNGTGQAFGAQVLLRQELASNFFGWVTYSLSRSTRQDQADQPERLFDYDQTHVLGVVASYEWRGFTFGVRFRYTTGLPRVSVAGAFYDSRDDTWQPVLGPRNSVRLPDFVQLDARVERTFTFKGTSLNIFLDVQNVWNQRNPEEIVYSADYSTRQYITGLPTLAVLGAKYEF
jgi:TonB family protein